MTRLVGNNLAGLRISSRDELSEKVSVHFSLLRHAYLDLVPSLQLATSVRWNESSDGGLELRLWAPIAGHGK